MKRRTVNTTLSLMSFLAGTAVFSEAALATDGFLGGRTTGKATTPTNAEFLACYQFTSTARATQRIVLDVKTHSPLTNFNAQRNFGISTQWAFDAIGKHVGVCGTGTMAVTSGGVVVADPSAFAGKTGVTTVTGTQFGAHLGLTTDSVRVTGTTPTCIPLFFDCTSSETSPIPLTWTCSFIALNGVAGTDTLVQVDPATDPLCGVFQDGTPLTTVTPTTLTPPAPAMTFSSGSGPMPAGESM